MCYEMQEKFMNKRKIATILGYAWVVVWFFLGIIVFAMTGGVLFGILITGLIIAVLIAGGSFLANRKAMWGGVVLAVLGFLPILSVFNMGLRALVGYLFVGR